MAIFARRPERKILREGRDLLKGARKLLRIRQDLLSEDLTRKTREACGQLAEALDRQETQTVQAQAARVDKIMEQVWPVSRRSALRENVEVFLVAAIVAMAVRTFILQPFKIPTGSMQPTLYGIHEPLDEADRAKPWFLQRIADLVLFGTHYSDGTATVRGDHIFVDKISYHFRKPRRGEVVVFETDQIPEMPPSARGHFYIKRLVGLGNDVLQINPPHLLVNGQVASDHPAFEHIYSMEDGYHGYVCQPPGSSRPRYLYSPQSSYRVPEKHLAVLGDNTLSSSDLRYWGSFPEDSLVGRAILVYWPFSRRLGTID